MSELESVASDAAPETAADTPVAAPQIETTTTTDEAPSKSARDALERAFSKVDGQRRDDTGKWTKAEADAKAAQAIADAKDALGKPDAAPVAATAEQPPTVTPAAWSNSSSGGRRSKNLTTGPARAARRSMLR